MSHRTGRWALLLVAALVLTGCPYGSEHPLASPDEAVADDALLGAWRGRDEDGDPLKILIRRASDRGYAITGQDPEGGDPEAMPAFVAVIDGEGFLSVQDEGLWFLTNYRVAGDRLLLRLVDDALFESRSFGSPEALRSFVRAHLGDPRLFGEAEGGDGEAQWDWILFRVDPAAALTSP